MPSKKYYPETPLFEGECYNSYLEYKCNRLDEFYDAWGNERLPRYRVDSDETFCCAVV